MYGLSFFMKSVGVDFPSFESFCPLSFFSLGLLPFSSFASCPSLLLCFYVVARDEAWSEEEEEEEVEEKGEEEGGAKSTCGVVRVYLLIA